MQIEPDREEKETFVRYMAAQVVKIVLVISVVIVVLAVINASGPASSLSDKATETDDNVEFTVEGATGQIGETEMQAPSNDFSPDQEITTSFGSYVSTTAVCEGEYWQYDATGIRPTLSWMDNGGTEDLASDDFYVEYEYDYDGTTLSLTNGRIGAYRLDNPIDGRRVSDKSFSLTFRSDGILLNGELLRACRN